MWFEACDEDEDGDGDDDEKERQQKKRQQVQEDGLRESAGFVKGAVEEEIERVGGDGRKVFLGGISQGMATGLWAFFSLGSLKREIGGFLGMSGWLPFAMELESPEEQEGARERFRRISGTETVAGARSTPVLLMHGADDIWVSVGEGKQAKRVLEGLGLSVAWREFTGAENDGHWVKEPEGFDSILQFFDGRETET